MTTFDRLSLAQWRQFSNVEIDLSANTTVLTGVNGCGKTTILNILSQHFGWNLSLIATPFLSKRKRKKIWSDLSRYYFDNEDPEQFENQAEIGSISYSNGETCRLLKPNNASNAAKYNLRYENRQNVNGLHIPSHRPAMNYQQVEQIPTNPKTKQQHYQDFQNLLLNTYHSENVRNPIKILKESLISLALFGYGNQAVVQNPEFRDLYETFQDILAALLPDELGFERLEIRMPDIVLITKTGEFALDAMSGGINAIFGIAWQIHMASQSDTDTTVVIDEPENHLHPSMQRKLLPGISEAFPRHHFVIATHSPFIVTSNPEAYVYGLIHGNQNTITAEKLSASDLAASPNKILRDILDVPTTIPIWAEKKISQILSRYENDEVDPKKIDRMYKELKEQGLTDALTGYFPDQE